MTNQFSQEPDLDKKGKALTSLILGAISAISVIIGKLILSSLRLSPQLPFFLQIIILIIFFIMPLIGIIGLVLGIMGLKSTKRNFATVGIVLSVIGLAVPLYYFLFQ